MNILSAKDIAGANAGIVGGEGMPCGNPSQSQFDSLNEVIRTRLENILEISTLSRMQFQDTFEVGIVSRFGFNTARPRRLRLTNAFLTSDPIVFVGTDGLPLDQGYVSKVDRNYGIVDTGLEPGTYTIQYTCGFLAEAGTKVYQDLPHWVKSVALATMFLWLRSMNRGMAIKDISHSALTNGMIRELNAHHGGRYQRPRVDCEFPTVSERRLITDPVSEWKQW